MFWKTPYPVRKTRNLTESGVDWRHTVPKVMRIPNSEDYWRSVFLCELCKSHVLRLLGISSNGEECHFGALAWYFFGGTLHYSTHLEVISCWSTFYGVRKNHPSFWDDEMCQCYFHRFVPLWILDYGQCRQSGVGLRANCVITLFLTLSRQLFSRVCCVVM